MSFGIIRIRSLQMEVCFYRNYSISDQTFTKKISVKIVYYRLTDVFDWCLQLHTTIASNSSRNSRNPLRSQSGQFCLPNTANWRTRSYRLGATPIRSSMKKLDFLGPFLHSITLRQEAAWLRPQDFWLGFDEIRSRNSHWPTVQVCRSRRNCRVS